MSEESGSTQDTESASDSAHNGAPTDSDPQIGLGLEESDEEAWAPTIALDEELGAALEAILFAADRPLGAEEVAEILERADGRTCSAVEARWALEQQAARLKERTSGIEIAAIAGGWQMRTRPRWAEYVHSLYQRKPVRLSRAALEVLAIIAYRQPCTRADVDEIRGVDSSSTLRQLVERDLIRILGKADDVGRPLLYGTSDFFLQFFGLNTLSELPTLREFTELTDEHLVRLEAWDETLRETADNVRAATSDAKERSLEALEKTEEDDGDESEKTDESP